MSMSLAIFKESFSTSLVGEGGDCFDEDAKKQVGTLLADFGYSVIDLGDLRDGGLIQQAGGPLAGRNLLEVEERYK
jgi:predicted dinucleotide-binding enzyme